MNYRKLRIAFSAACGIICLLLIVLWVRSYWWIDTFILQVTRTQAVRITTGFGVDVEIVDLLSHGIKSQPTKLITDAAEVYSDSFKPYSNWKTLGFYVGPSDDFGYVAMLPYPFVVLVPIALATAPWLPHRFSLRTLLIGMTLVAVALGALIYAAK